MRKVDILIAKLKAKQRIRKVKEARMARAMEKMQNVPTNQPIGQPEAGAGQPPPVSPTNQPGGLGVDDGVGVEP